MRLMDTPDGVTGPINLGNPGEFTIRELAEKVIELTGSRSQLVHRPLPEDDPMQRQPDIARAKALLGWEPTVALEEGLRKTIAYFEDLLAGRAGVYALIFGAPRLGYRHAPRPGPPAPRSAG